ncbi:hypothetical protein QRX50_18395 [Amycolatopsis carbonis]|uniref:Uncharacterized protein n=1 Tax=Amycolatopsis carbonis TaxID=715471 RepID=A0A9Y2MZH1_9PSEU|nr:hypothetical protein [Amycolatopsis sp. 2-15]WIX82598.1 hypothetical protein QRX50_18395 [Amycolatopsis sp. 2-15]
MNKVVAALLLPALLLPLAACGTKSYTYDTKFAVDGKGTAKVSLEYPGGKGPHVSTEKLPAVIGLIPEGLGKVTMHVQAQDGPVTCRIIVEQKQMDQKSGKDVTCATELTEDTEN